MGRSVSVPAEAVEVFYLDWSRDIFDDLDSDDAAVYYWLEWSYLIDDLRQNVFGQFPSVVPADWWLGDEDRVIAENDLAAFGISEYCGLAAVWVVAKTQSFHWSRGQYYEPNLDGLARSWIARTWPKVEAMFPDRLGLVGRFSNGEAVYRKVATQ